MRLSVVLCVGLAACGESAPADPDAASQLDALGAECAAPGSGSVAGSVMGAQVAPVRTAKVSLYASVPTIVLAETVGPDLCAGPMPAAGDYLNIFVCAKSDGTYPLSGYVPTCPSPTGGAVFAVASSGGTTLSRSTGGMVTLEIASATCMKGTFSIAFDTADTVTGSFAAEICP